LRISDCGFRNPHSTIRNGLRAKPALGLSKGSSSFTTSATRRRWAHTQCDLGDAYIRNGQPQRAIDLLTPLHRADPDQIAYRHVILDALFALGRREKDFDWVVAPRVRRLGPEVLDACFVYLRSKRRPRLVLELAGAVLADDYQAFSNDDLLAALRLDVCFVVESGSGLPGVGVARGGVGRHRGGGRGRGEHRWPPGPPSSRPAVASPPQRRARKGGACFGKRQRRRLGR
jgi:hypothetical protein